MNILHTTVAQLFTNCLIFFKALEPELEYNGMPTLDEFLNTSKDTTEFAGWLEVCIFLNTSNLRLIIVFCWIVFQALSVVKMQVC